MTNYEWLNSLTEVQIRILANKWAIPYHTIRDIDFLRDELSKIDGVQTTPKQEETYTERLLAYWNPLLMKNLSNKTHEAEYTTSRCYDYIKMEAIINDGLIEFLEFFVRGCCISQCSAAMLVEHFRGKYVKEVLSFTQEDMLNLVGIKTTKIREDCVLASLQCLRKLCGQA